MGDSGDEVVVRVVYSKGDAARAVLQLIFRRGSWVWSAAGLISAHLLCNCWCTGGCGRAFDLFGTAHVQLLQANRDGNAVLRRPRAHKIHNFKPRSDRQFSARQSRDGLDVNSRSL